MSDTAAAFSDLLAIHVGLLYIPFISAPLGLERAGVCNEHGGLSSRFRDMITARSLSLQIAISWDRERVEFRINVNSIDQSTAR